MYQLLISDESRFDILDAVSWYEERVPGLGKELENCLDEGFNKILSNALHYQKRYKNLRIHFINKFPYGIHYLVEENVIKVFGVFHTSRSPRNWTSRLKQAK
jgi:toxin ParE1/3/4